MKPIRTTLLAAMTAAIAIAPLASAEAHKRHRHGGDVAAAIALGLFAAGVASRAHRHHHHHIYRHGNRCYGLAGWHYRKCLKGGHYYGVPSGYYPHGYYYRRGGLGAGGHIHKNGR